METNKDQNKKDKPSIAHRIGDALETLGDKIEHSSLKKVGDAIEKLGDEVQHLGEKKEENTKPNQAHNKY